MPDPYLYLLHMTGTDLYKIGIAARPWKRLEQIAGGKHAVTVVRVWPELAYFERTLHRQYAGKRIRSADERLPVSGRTEWFELAAADVEQVKADCYCERLQYQARRRAKLRALVSGSEGDL